MAAIKVHSHPIAVHFSNGLIPVSIFFLFLFFVTQSPDMEIVAFYTLLTGTLGSGLAIVTGLYDWKKNYKGAWVPVFKKKLTAGILSVLAGTFACLIHFYYPGLLYSITSLSLFYIALNFIMLGCVSFAGYLGGNLVFQ
jgi:uncharacterized membrane protein